MHKFVGLKKSVLRSCRQKLNSLIFLNFHFLFFSNFLFTFSLSLSASFALYLCRGVSLSEYFCLCPYQFLYLWNSDSQCLSLCVRMSLFLSLSKILSVPFFCLSVSLSVWWSSCMSLSVLTICVSLSLIFSVFLCLPISFCLSFSIAF